MIDYPVNLLYRVIETYSPTGHEEALVNLLNLEMKKLGFEVERDYAGNLIGKIDGENPTILLCGHLDTVPPELPVKIDESYIYGRGAVDAKAPLIALLVAASQLRDEGYSGKLIVACVVDEEGYNKGIKQLIKDRVKADYAVFGEPTNVDTITIGYKGGISVVVTCETETGHSSAPWLFENAIEKAYEIWELLKDIKFPQEDPNSIFNSLTPCLLGIQGGEKGSVVPPYCMIRVSFRIPPSLSVNQLQEVINTRIHEYMLQNPKVKIKIKTIDSTEPYLVDKKSFLVKAFARSIWKIRKTRAKLMNKTGTGDMNHYGPEMDIPVITYGPGNSHLDHTPHEKVSIKDFLDSIEVIKESLRIIIRNFNNE
jgi:LysW-gamma-L-lysine carboxypeptidase